MKRLTVAAACLTLLGCHDFASELSQCIDAGACIAGSTTEIPPDAKIELDATFTSLDFVGWAVGSMSSVKSAPFKNKGAQTSGPLTVTLSGANADNFIIQNDGCTGRQLEPSATCVVSLVFSPLSATGKSADLTVSADPGGTVQLPLTGQGLDPARLELTPLVKNFGPITAGSASTSETFTLTNSGSVNATGLSVQLEGSDAGGFQIISNGCPQSLGATPCVVVARFEPPTIGAFTANLVARADNGLMASSTLVGDGLAPPSAQLTASAPSIDFQNWNVGSTSTAQQVIINNIGGQTSGPLAVSLAGANGPDFAVSMDGCSGIQLAPMGTCTLQLTFAPTGAALRTATLSAVANPGGAASVQLRGTGQVPAALSFSPSPWDFGAYALDAGVGRSFTLTNLGTLPATNLSVQITDVDAGRFVITNNTCALTLDGTMNCQVFANFTATTVGAASAVLRAQADGVTTQVDLSGTGLAPSNFLVTPSSYDFGDVVKNLSSPPLTITVQNIGAVTTTPLTVTQTGSFVPSFIKANDACTGATLLPSQSCTFQVTFRPTSSLTSMLVSEEIRATTGGIINANLTGRGISEANVVVLPTSYDFGDVDAGLSASYGFTLWNAGDNSSGPLSLTVSTRDGGSSFLLGGNCNNVTLAGDAGCTETVSFSPTGYGRKLGLLRVFATPGADGGTSPDGGSFAVDGGPTASAALSGLGHGMVSINLILNGVSMGTGVVLPDGGGCTSTCVLQVEGGMSTTITADPAKGWFFQRWTGPCDGGTSSTCTVTPTSGATLTLDAGFDHYNFAFVTSNKYLGNLNPGCNALARDGGFPGNYIPMRTWNNPVGDCGDGGTTCGGWDNYFTQFSNIRGWVRTDGKPWFDVISSLSFANSHTLFPMACDEHSVCLEPADAGGEFFWTGEDVSTGTWDPLNYTCANWTSSSSTVYGVVGTPFGTGSRLYTQNPPLRTRCNVAQHFVCIEVDKDYLFGTRFVQPVPAGGRRAFVSARNTITGNTPKATADLHCRNEAADAGLPNAMNFVALRTGLGTSGSSSVELDGGDWYRVDGYRVVTPAALASYGFGVLEAPLNMNARGAVLGSMAAPAMVWTGGPLDGGPAKLGDAGTTCNNWSTGSSTVSGVMGTTELMTSGYWTEGTYPCNTAGSVYCFEN